MEMIKELLVFVNSRDKYWLWPLLAMMLFLGLLTVLAEGSAIAPFIYSVF